MPYSSLDRITSLGNDGVFTSTIDAASARNNLRDNIGSSIAVTVTNPFLSWPRLDNFFNDNNPNPTFSGAPQPQFIWNKPEALPNDQVFFAVGSRLFSIGAKTSTTFSVHLTSFSDNAHQVEEIRLFEVSGTNPPFAYTPVFDLVNASPPAFTTAPLEDGPLTQPNPELEPFFWQTIRYYSNSFDFNNVDTSVKKYQIIVVFRTKNYPTPTVLAENPGGLAFCIDIFGTNVGLATI